MKKRARLQKAKKIFEPSRFEQSIQRLFPEQLLQRHFPWLRNTRALPEDPQAMVLRAIAKKDYRSRYLRRDTEALFEYVAVQGEEAFEADWVKEAIRDLRLILSHGDQILIDEKTRRDPRRHARLMLYRIGRALANVAGSGRTKELSAEEVKAIATACNRWLPLCQQLNKVFKRLWKVREYQTSQRYRKEARGRLAEKHSISVEDVKDLEVLLERGTPWEAMLRIVARKNTPVRSPKTIEKVYSGLS